MDAVQTCPVPTGVGGDMFMTLIKLLMASQCFLNTNYEYPTNMADSIKDGDEYDFIVVGAGSAGSVVASRLSENPKWKVLLVEAGDYPSTTSEIPSQYLSLQNTAEDWAYLTEKNEHFCQGFQGQQCKIPMGKVLGGSGTIHALNYQRGSPKDYDDWHLNGNYGWDYSSVFPYFLKSENYQGPPLPHLSALHSCFGNLTIHKKEPQDFLTNTLLKQAIHSMGYQYFDDEVNLGFFTSLKTVTKNGTRSTSAKAFLSRLNKRENLHLILNSQVGKITFNEKNATGVEIRIGESNTINVKASKEVILSAGAVNSPQILMNSGIGPQEHLKQLNIDLIKDLRVGENLQDHLTFHGYFLSIPDLHLNHDFNLQDELYHFFAKQSGYFTSNHLFDFKGMVKTNPHLIGHEADVQISHFLIRKGDVNALDAYSNSLGLISNITEQLRGVVKNSSLLVISPSLVKPKSRGKVLLTSSESLYSNPRIYPNYMTDEWNEDFNTLLKGVQFIDAYASHLKVSSVYGIETVKPNLFECLMNNKTDYLYNSNDNHEFYSCALKYLASSGNSLVGSCKMGPSSDKMSVVSPRLKVHGFNNLRVVDASIMPSIISVDTFAAAVMIGEKGAAMIREDWYEDQK